MAHILVADDEKSVRDVVTRLLTTAGHKVAEAADGEQALAMLEGGGFNLAVIDVIMPKKGGIETLMDIHAGLRGLKVLLISGKVDTGSEAFRNLANSFGGARVLKKPFSREELLGTVDELLSPLP